MSHFESSEQHQQNEVQHQTPYQAVHMEEYPMYEDQPQVSEDQPQHQKINIIGPKN